MVNAMFEFDGEKHIYNVLAGKVLIGELYIESDGFWVFNPNTQRSGYWPAWMLKNIADKLDELNHEWQAILEESFAAFDPEALDSAEVLK